jgi:hypothetical protein
MRQSAAIDTETILAPGRPKAESGNYKGALRSCGKIGNMNAKDVRSI